LEFSPASNIDQFWALVWIFSGIDLEKLTTGLVHKTVHKLHYISGNQFIEFDKFHVINNSNKVQQ
jgi:hypothetical protein